MSSKEGYKSLVEAIFSSVAALVKYKVVGFILNSKIKG